MCTNSFVYFRFFVYFLISFSWKYLQTHHEGEIIILHKTLISAEKKWCLSLGKYLNDVTASKHDSFSLCRRPGSAFSPSSTSETSLVPTRYGLLYLSACSGAGSASTSAQSHRQRRMNQTAYNSFKLGDGLRCSHCVLSQFNTFRTE